MQKMPIKMVVGTNSLSEAQYPAYTNHCRFWFELGRYFPHISVIQVNPSRVSIDNMRNLCGRVAINQNADYVLFLDDDVVVHEPRVAIEKLLACDSDIAAGNVIIRNYPFDYMFFDGNHIKGLESVKNIPKKLGKKDYGAVGFSLCLIKVSLLKKIEPDWFVTPANSTEDIYFCIKALNIVPGCSIVVDTSVTCGHILWPEIIDTHNRLKYKKYIESLGGIVKNAKKS